MLFCEAWRESGSNNPRQRSQAAVPALMWPQYGQTVVRGRGVGIGVAGGIGAVIVVFG